MEADQDAAGFGPELRRRLLLVRMCRLLRGRVAESRGVPRVSPDDSACGFCPSQMWPDREPESLRRPPKSFI